MKMQFPTILLLLVSSALAIPVELATLLDESSWPANGHGPTDEHIVNQTLRSINSLYTNTSSNTLDSCSRCKTTLEIGKAISLTKPNLIPEIFTRWCTEQGIASAANCKTYYSKNTVTASRTGTDFTNMLQLLDPWSIDGDYLCYYKMSQCPLPELPKIDLSSYWPEKNVSNIPQDHQITTGIEKFNVLHISDFHIQLDYQIGSEANCTNNGMCCTTHTWNKNTIPSNLDNSDAKFFDSFYDDDFEFHLGDNVTEDYYNETVWVPAREFGAYTCDSPELLINSSLKSIVEYQKQNNMSFDFVIFTGDMVDHDQLEHTDYEMTIESQEIIMRDLKKYLPDIPIFAVLGNHDTFPYGQLAPHNSGHDNLYTWNEDLFADLWVGYDWLPFEDYQSIKKHYTGFSVTTKRGLKVISINSNTYYQKNYYSYWNMTEGFDNFGTIKFIIDELIESEQKGQKVWIIAHIPFVDYDTLPIQAEVYKQIVSRFSPTTIAGLFFGHTHQDQFNVLYDVTSESNNNTDRSIENAIMNTWISQSVTPLSNYNPGWRFYEVDSQSFEVMNSHNFYTQLNSTFDNKGSEPVWEFEYSAREAYDPTNEWPLDAPLNATFWAIIAEKIKSNETVAQAYGDYSFRLSPKSPVCSEEGECDDFYCYVTSFNINEYNQCLDS